MTCKLHWHPRFKSSTAVLYDVDTILQRGSFDDARIAAWALAGDARYVLPYRGSVRELA
jgi:hypothetical protein